jgi:LmbE family N-acetylglucosaminyl deacetylase
MKKIVAIFAHPDDEILACGGMLAKHAMQGDDVHILILATGLTSRGKASDDELESLQQDAKNAAKALGVDKVSFGGLPDNAMDSVALLDVVKVVESFLNDHPSSVIYTHHMGDMNIDHQVTARAVLTAARPLPGGDDLTILAGEVNSSTEYAPPPMTPFTPTEYHNIDDALDKKIAAMACYKTELRDWPHPRSLEAIEYQAKNRGAQSGMNAAEAFMTLRRIVT